MVQAPTINSSRNISIDSSLQKEFELASPKPRGYWTSERGKNARKFFEAYAEQANFDPLEARNWYTISQATIAAVEVNI